MQSENSPSPQDTSLAKLKELIDDIRIASLVTIDSEGALRSRPMVTQQMDSEAELWFFTNDHAALAGDIAVNPQVCVSYAAPDRGLYVSVSGSATLVEDFDKIRELWSPALKAWFPEGINDPKLALLRVDIVSAQYWDSSGNKLVQLYTLLKAIATGESAAGKMGEHKTLTVRERIGSDTAT